MINYNDFNLDICLKLYDDLISTNNYSSQFAITEIVTPTKYTLNDSKTVSIFNKLYYSTIAADLTITLPSGTSTLMFGCKAMFDGSTEVAFGSAGTGKDANLCGIMFGIADADKKLDTNAIYANFNNVGSGIWNDARKTFRNSICGKTIADYTNSGAMTEVAFNIFLYSVIKGDLQMIGQLNDNKHKFVNQFWVMRVG